MFEEFQDACYGGILNIWTEQLKQFYISMLPQTPPAIKFQINPKYCKKVKKAAILGVYPNETV